MHCPGGNAADPIWRVLVSSNGISCWTPLKPQPTNPNPLANQLWCIDFLTPPIPLIIPHRLRAFLESLMLLKNWCLIQDGRKAVWSIPYVSVAFFPSLKQNFIAYRSSKVSDCIFEIHQLWQSGFSRVYSNCCCSCSFEAGIIKIGQSSHKMYSNNILNFQESTTILNACTKKSLETYWMHHVSISCDVDTLKTRLGKKFKRRYWMTYLNCQFHKGYGNWSRKRKNSELKPLTLLIKIDLASHPAHGKEDG